MEDKFFGPEVKNYALSLNAQVEINTTLFPDIIKDRTLYEKFKEKPKQLLKEYRIDVPQDVDFNIIETGEKVIHIFLPHPDFEKLLAELNRELAEKYKTEGEPYVQVEARWWGLVFVLSDAAAKDLATGQVGIAGITATITGILSMLPAPANSLALVPGVISVILTLQSTLVTLLNRGKGVYITALWPVIGSPLMWIPTTRE
jgi:hypothetical protein